MAATRSSVVVSAAEWDESVRMLLELGRGTEALATLQRAIEVGGDSRRMQALLTLLEGFPPPLRASDAGVRLHLRLLGNMPGGLVSMMEMSRSLLAGGRDAAFMHVFQAWGLAETEEDEASLGCSEEVLGRLGELLPFERVLFWRARGRSLARLGQSGWLDAYGLALAEAQGRARLLTLLEVAAVQVRFGSLTTAMSALSEALVLAGGDVLEIRVAEQLGLLCLGLGDFAEAERHFRLMARLADRSRAGSERCRALCSLAVVRRAQGEWAQAEHLYGEALREAVRHGDEDDQRQALRGLGHTRRLSGRPLGALELLEQAARVVRADRESGTSWVYVDVAAALVSLSHLDSGAVTGALERVEKASAEDLMRAQVVRAELLRRQGEVAGALELLRGVKLRSLGWREESHALGELFALLPEEERPLPLPRVVRTVVRLRAMGFAQVSVNGRTVKVSPLGAAVLAALLDGAGEASVGELVEVLRDGTPRAHRQAEQRVSKVVNTLRRDLGWEGCIVTRPGHYALSQDVLWEYDVAEVLAAGREVTVFLSGVDLPWVSEREQVLSLRD